MTNALQTNIIVNYRHFLVPIFVLFFIFNNGATLAGCSRHSLTLRHNSKVVFEGDSLIYGFDPSHSGVGAPINSSDLPRSSNPFPEGVQDMLANRIVVINHGYPGDRSVDGLRRWAQAATTPLTFVMYGTNDYGNYGGLTGGPISQDEFKVTLSKLVERRLSHNGAVVLMTTAPLQDPEEDRKLEKYRAVTSKVAAKHGIIVIDVPLLLRNVPDKWIDGVHLTQSANKELSKRIAKLFCITK